jgi:NAD+ diphosphatase
MHSPFRHCPQCGKAPFDLRATNLLACEHCGFHYYLNPIVAVAAILIDAHGSTLLVRRAKNPALGKLAMAGGFVDLEETAEAAVRREVREEVGLELAQVEYLTSYPNHYPYADYLYRVLDLFFCARLPSFEAARALAEVDSLWVGEPQAIDPAELAFDSMRHAWRCFMTRWRDQPPSGTR